MTSLNQARCTCCKFDKDGEPAFKNVASLFSSDLGLFRLIIEIPLKYQNVLTVGRIAVLSSRQRHITLIVYFAICTWKETCGHLTDLFDL